MKRKIFFDEYDCSWHCDLDTMTVIDKDSEIKGQPIPEHWKQWQNPKPSNLLNPPKKDIWSNYRR